MGTALAQATAPGPSDVETAADATDCYTFPRDLSEKQRTAISALVTGLSDRETAEHAGVHRVTITRWRLYDAAFQAVYLQRLSDHWAVAAEHLRALVPQAMDTLHYLLECGDDRTRLKAALGILKLADRTSPRR